LTGLKGGVSVGGHGAFVVPIFHPFLDILDILFHAGEFFILEVSRGQEMRYQVHDFGVYCMTG